MKQQKRKEEKIGKASTTQRSYHRQKFKKAKAIQGYRENEHRTIEHIQKAREKTIHFKVYLPKYK